MERSRAVRRERTLGRLGAPERSGSGAWTLGPLPCDPTERRNSASDSGQFYGSRVRYAKGQNGESDDFGLDFW